MKAIRPGRANGRTVPRIREDLHIPLEPYAALVLSGAATAAEIKQAYRKLARAQCTDLRPDDATAEVRLKDFSAANDFLKDLATRARYDADEIDASGSEPPPRQYFCNFAAAAGNAARGFPSHGMVLLALIATVMLGVGLRDRDATAGRLMTGSSPFGAMVSSVMWRAGWTAHSSLCSGSKAPASRTIAFSSGKMPMTPVRRPIPPPRIEWRHPNFPG